MLKIGSLDEIDPPGLWSIEKVMTIMLLIIMAWP
jgi:hypothetical protein